MDRKKIRLILSDTLDKRKIPVLVLDSRWYDLFPADKKPSSISQLEDKVNDLLKEQGRLVNELKDMKRAKKKLMGEIVSKMGYMTEKEKKQNQRLILEMNERIEVETRRVMDLPYEIQKANQELLVEGIYLFCAEVGGSRQEMNQLKGDIQILHDKLMDMQDKYEEMQKNSDQTYSYLHNLIGPTANVLFDDK